MRTSPALELAAAGETAGGGPILLTQRDLRELQLATGAIRAGIALLLRRHGLEPCELDRVLVGGGFGNFIRRSNAQRIGLLPWHIEHRRIRYQGNTSLAGAADGRLASAPGGGRRPGPADPTRGPLPRGRFRNGLCRRDDLPGRRISVRRTRRVRCGRRTTRDGYGTDRRRSRAPFPRASLDGGKYRLALALIGRAADTAVAPGCPLSLHHLRGDPRPQTQISSANSLHAYAAQTARLEIVPERFVAALAGMRPQTLMAASGFERAAARV